MSEEPPQNPRLTEMLERPAAEAGLLHVQQMSQEQLREFAKAGYLYALLDACDAPAVPPKMNDLGEQRAVPLLRGSDDEQYSALAPYLIAVDPPTLDWIVQTLWKEAWGIFALARADLERLRQHFRRFLIVQLPDGEQWFFRYCDPRIFKIYLPNCNGLELQKFFGPVRAFAVADPEQNAIWAALLPTIAAPDGSDTDADFSPLWKIRPEQHAAFTREALKDFENRVVAHLAGFFPEQCQALGDGGIRQAIHYGIERAASYAIVAEPDVCKYIDLMFAFGPDFDRNATFEWTQHLLASEDPTVKIDRAYQSAMRTIQ